jgi:hypothetical protein
MQTGVRLEDQARDEKGNYRASVWKLEDAAELKKEREAKAAGARDKEIKKMQTTIAARKKLLSRWDGHDIPIKELFARQAAYTGFKFDDNGTSLPHSITHNSSNIHHTLHAMTIHSLLHQHIA